MRQHHIKPEYRVPRAIIGRVQANTADPKAMLAELSASMTDFRARHDTYASEQQRSIDELTATVGALRTGNGAVAAGAIPPDPEYTRKRVGGGVLDPKAVSLLRVSAG